MCVSRLEESWCKDSYYGYCKEAHRAHTPYSDYRQNSHDYTLRPVDKAMFLSCYFHLHALG